MAIKEIKREWSPCQLGYVKHFLLHDEEDVKDLPRCSVGSTATVSATDNEYVYTVSGWKLKSECDEDGGTGGGGGGPSVQPDWAQTDETKPDFIRNRPFGEILGDTLTWEIDTGSLDVENLPGGAFVKVSDSIVTMDDVANGCTFESGDGVADLPAEFFTQTADGAISMEGMIIFVDNPAVGVDIGGLVFPESGVYVQLMLASGKLKIPGYTDFVGTKQMDQAYLPSITVRQVVLYVGLDDEGVRRVYKDSERSEKLTNLDMFLLLRQKNYFFAVASDDGDTDLRYVVHAHNQKIIYATADASDGGVASFKVAYTFDG